MGKEISKKALALEYIKVSTNHLDNRCDKCGRRLKLHPGGLILWAPRFTTCRSCGYENPSLWEKVAESLSAAGYDLPTDGSAAELPECLNCGVELQVSRDFTKVFCRSCGREWSVPDFEDILEAPLDMKLAGRLPMQPDESKPSKELLALLEEQNIDYSTPYLVLPLALETEMESGTGKKQKSDSGSFFKAFSDGFKEGLAESKPESKGTKAVRDSSYLAVFEDYLAKYSLKNGNLKAEEVQYSDFFKRDQDLIDPGFEITFSSKKNQAQYNTLINELRTIFLTNQNPYKEVLFGKAKAEAEQTDQSALPSESVAEQIQKLAELKIQGLLTDEEFTAAKAKLLKI